MPDDVKLDADLPEVKPAPEPVIDPRMDKLELSLTRLERLFTDTLAGSFKPTTQATSTAPAIEDVTDEEIEEALQTGKGAGKFRKMVNAAVQKQTGAKIAQLESVGLGAIANLTAQLAQQNMPHYKRYKGEIDGILDSLDPSARLNPKVLEMAYNAVVGAHHNELLEEEQTKTKRASAQGGQDVGGGGQRKVGASTDRGAKAVFGEASSEALKEVGRDEDGMARRMGYKSWDDYLEKCKDFLGN